MTDVADIDEEVSEFVSRVEEYDTPLNNKNGLDEAIVKESKKYSEKQLIELSDAEFLELASSKDETEALLVYLDDNKNHDIERIALRFEEVVPSLCYNRFANSVAQSLLYKGSPIRAKFVHYLMNKFEDFLTNSNANRVL